MAAYFASLKPSQVENVGSIFCHLRHHERELLEDVRELNGGLVCVFDPNHHEEMLN